jgi:hypothetical protein
MLGHSLHRILILAAGLALFAGLCGTARGQGNWIGARGGQTAPTAPPATAVPTVPATPIQPVLPSTLNLPPEATSSLLNGLNSSGTALRPGMGWLVSDLNRQGIRGRQLADVIRQLKPYKQRGVLTFPQNPQSSASPPPGPPPLSQPTTSSGPQLPPLPAATQDDRDDALGKGGGKGGGKGRGKGGGKGGKG